MLKRCSFVVLLIAGLLSINVIAQQWRPVSDSRQANISGMALVERNKQHTVFLVVHDNKKIDQLRIELLTVDGEGQSKFILLDWLGKDIPGDLESVTSIPGVAGQFIAVTQPGRGYQIKLDLDKNTVDTLRTFDIPMKPKDSAFEAFALQKINDTLVAVWADRGSPDKPATLFYCKFDPATDTFTSPGQTEISVPYPTNFVRHIADVKVDGAGGVFIVSTSDPGKDGPFSSAFYLIGTVAIGADKQVAFSKQAVFTQLRKFDLHKVEGFEFVPGPGGGIAFGTDDENLGAAVFLDFS